MVLAELKVDFRFLRQGELLGDVGKQLFELKVLLVVEDEGVVVRKGVVLGVVLLLLFKGTFLLLALELLARLRGLLPRL